MSSRPIKRVIINYPPHFDTILAYWILRKFGRTAFPGIQKAKLGFAMYVPLTRVARMEAKGVLFLDLGGGELDHHGRATVSGVPVTLSQIVAEEKLSISPKHSQVLSRFLAVASRDEQGKSQAPNDKPAAGLAGMLSALKRGYSKSPHTIVTSMIPFLNSMYHQDYVQNVIWPDRWPDFSTSGAVQSFVADNGVQTVHGRLVYSGAKHLIGWMFINVKVADVTIDVIVQRRQSGHTNILTNPWYRRLLIAPVAAALRKAEAEALGELHLFERKINWATAGRLDAIPQWYYDNGTNTIQNGGISRTDVPATCLSPETILGVLDRVLPECVSPVVTNITRKSKRYRSERDRYGKPHRSKTRLNRR